MVTLRSRGGSHSAARGIAEAQPHEMQQDHQGPLDGELLDLYVAILIAVPLAFFLKSLWF